MKKLLVLIVSFLMIISIFGCSNKTKVDIKHSDKENVEFNEFLDKEFKEAMEADYLNNHYTLNDSKAMGIVKPEPKLDPKDFDLESYEDFIEDAQLSLEELKAFDKESLSEKQYYDYLDYENNLNNYLELNKYPLFDNYFSPSNGIQENLLTIFMEFDFRHADEFEDYLSLLEGVPEYMDAAIELTKYQAINGHFLSDNAVDQTVSGIDRFTSKLEDNELIASFDYSVDINEDLTEAQKIDLKARNKDLILNSFIPTYLNLRKELISLKGSRSVEGGLANFKDGKEYYSLYIKNQTGLDLSVKQLFDMLDSYLQKTLKNYAQAYMKDSESFESVSYEINQLKDFETEDILEFVKENMSKDFPQGPDVNYSISYLDETTANSSILAYYLNPPVDMISENVIRVNPNTGEDKIQLYSTVSHEGFPGHLYQITYDLNTKPHPIRTNISNISYTEGWAMYTELIAFDYLDLTEAENITYKLDVQFGYVLSAALDLAVNGLGYDYNKTEKWLSEYIEARYIKEMYEGAIDDPGLIVPYGVGLVYYDNLRDKAEDKLKDKFNVVDFHQVILKNSDRPLSILESDVDKYIYEVLN